MTIGASFRLPFEIRATRPKIEELAGNIGACRSAARQDQYKILDTNAEAKDEAARAQPGGSTFKALESELGGA